MKATNMGIMGIDVKRSILEQGFEVQNIEKKILGNKYELKVVLEDKVCLETYYKHQPRNVVLDEILANIKAKGLQTSKWMLTKNQQLMKLNLGTNAKPQMVKINAHLETSTVLEME